MIRNISNQLKTAPKASYQMTYTRRETQTNRIDYASALKGEDTPRERNYKDEMKRIQKILKKGLNGVAV